MDFSRVDVKVEVTVDAKVETWGVETARAWALS
jgi:hypothetical protein